MLCCVSAKLQSTIQINEKRESANRGWRWVSKRSNNPRKQLHYGAEQLQIGCCLLFFRFFPIFCCFCSFIHCKCHCDVYLRVYNAHTTIVMCVCCAWIAHFCCCCWCVRSCILRIYSLFFVCTKGHRTKEMRMVKMKREKKTSKANER